MIGNVVLVFKTGRQLWQADSVFRDDAIHEFLEGIRVASFGGVEQVECLFDGERRQLSLGIFEDGERSGDRIGDGQCGIDDVVVLCGFEFADFPGGWFQQVVGLIRFGGGLF